MFHWVFFKASDPTLDSSHLNLQGISFELALLCCWTLLPLSDYVFFSPLFALVIHHATLLDTKKSPFSSHLLYRGFSISASVNELVK